MVVLGTTKQVVFGTKARKNSPKKTREQVQSEIDAYLANGGEIEQVASGVSGLPDKLDYGRLESALSMGRRQCKT